MFSYQALKRVTCTIIQRLVYERDGALISPFQTERTSQIPLLLEK